jgi:four helix bundle protein
MAYGIKQVREGIQVQRCTMAFRFEDLEIFHLALEFATKAYTVTKKFPTEEKFDLTSQARRAANSIALNIAEGSGRGTKRDFSHFLDIAVGSTFEVVTCFFLAKKHGYISEQDLQGIKDGRRADFQKDLLVQKCSDLTA